MKEIRGAKAVQYAKNNGLTFSIDEDFLAQTESELRGQPASMDDVENLFEEELGEPYDPTDVFDGTESYKFLLDRYGDGWIYVPLEGNHPLQEERAVLRLYYPGLKAENPYSGGDILDLATENPPRLRNTGFPKDADIDLLFHAALRLVRKGALRSIRDPTPASLHGERNYGDTYFFIPTDLQISLSHVLCNHCAADFSYPSLTLHDECARRLKATLTKALSLKRESNK